ncbi:MAG: hypothetical protein PGN07_09470 [Aeromicrobium erythreum]
MNRITRKLVLTLAGTALVAPVGAVGVAQSASADASGAKVTAASSVETKATISGTTVINRAKTWMTAHNGGPVPYSQSATYGGYRTDCSGYVSMAYGYGKPGLNTVGLADPSVSTRFTSKANLRKGDTIIDPNGTSTSRHVVIFEKWANDAKTSYWAYEQRGTYGTTHRKLSYGLKADAYDFYRQKKLA